MDTLDLAREVLFVDFAAGFAPGGVGVWAATAGRARAGRGADEPPPSRVSDTSMAPFTSPKGPPPPALGLGATWIGLEFVLSCTLFSKRGQVDVTRSTQRRQHEGIDCIFQHRVVPFGWALHELSDWDRSRGRRTRDLGRPGRKPRTAGRGRLRDQRFGSSSSGYRRRRSPGYGEGCGTRRALDLTPGPLFVAGDVLPALRAGEFDLSHRLSRSGCRPTTEVLSR